MALYEVEHPLAQQVSTVIVAAEQGLCASEFVPPHTSLTYLSPLETASGAATLQAFDERTTRVSTILVPFLSGQLDSELAIITSEGIVPTDARISVVNINGKAFSIDFSNDLSSDVSAPSPILQFDVDHAGIFFTAHPNGERRTRYGSYEGEIYSRCGDLVGRLAGINDLYTASIRYLDSIS